jgi:hypothetical protein
MIRKWSKVNMNRRTPSDHSSFSSSCEQYRSVFRRTALKSEVFDFLKRRVEIQPCSCVQSLRRRVHGQEPRRQWRLRWLMWLLFACTGSPCLSLLLFLEEPRPLIATQQVFSILTGFLLQLHVSLPAHWFIIKYERETQTRTDK